MENTHNVAKGSSGSHTVLELENLEQIFQQLNNAERETGQPEGWYTSPQIYEALGVSTTKGQRLLKEGVKKGLIEFTLINWVDWDGINRQHRCFRVKEEKDG